MSAVCLHLQVVDQNIKNVEDLQDDYNFKINTLKNRGERALPSDHKLKFSHFWRSEENHFHVGRKRNERHDGEGAGEREDADRDDVLRAESQTSGGLQINLFLISILQ